MVSTVAVELSEIPEFVEVVGLLSRFLVIVVIGGVALSYLAHSSLAVVLFAASLASVGAIENLAAVYVVFGANIGSGLLPFLANLRNRKGARLPVSANFILRTSCALAACLIFPWIETTWNVTSMMTLIPTPLAMHLVLNCLVALIGFTFRKSVLRSVGAFLGEDVKNPNFIEARYLDDALSGRPTDALAAAKREALVMAETAQDMVGKVLPLFKEGSSQQYEELEALEDSVDRLFNAIKSYLTDIMQSPLTPDESRKSMDLLNFVTNMEHIGDIVDRNLVEQSYRLRALHSQFSDAGMAEIERLHEAVMDNFDLAIRVFLSDETELAKQLVGTKADVRKPELRSIETHVERLGTGQEDSVETSELHLDVLRDIKRINSHITSIAYPVLSASGEVPTTKWKRVRKGRNPRNILGRPVVELRNLARRAGQYI